MLSIDRFEGEFAVCITTEGLILNIYISQIPDGAKEGTVILKKDNIYVIDKNNTIKKRDEIIKFQDSLWE